MSKQGIKLNKKKAIAILIYSNMEIGKRYATIEFMKLLELSQAFLYNGIKILTTLKFIKAYNGNTKGGLEKTTDFSIEKLCLILGVNYSNDNDIIDKCDEVIDAIRKPTVCDICSESILFVDKHGVCVDCLELVEPVPQPRLARCGHLSSTRYFKCETCLETLDSEDDVYSINLRKP